MLNRTLDMFKIVVMLPGKMMPLESFILQGSKNQAAFNLIRTYLMAIITLLEKFNLSLLEQLQLKLITPDLICYQVSKLNIIKIKIHLFIQ